uniref:Uncharacterized protein n=1 Tax=Bionectria ochroleuca TaxID=29856 RepID=A0A8H7TVK1_BIOOC
MSWMATSERTWTRISSGTEAIGQGGCGMPSTSGGEGSMLSSAKLARSSGIVRGCAGSSSGLAAPGCEGAEFFAAVVDEDAVAADVWDIACGLEPPGKCFSRYLLSTPLSSLRETQLVTMTITSF